ncbi:hypothetical protein D8I35_16115 [Corticibacter populi]|uniref:Chemoreceptor zinc-binding domain-containing protein n=2 Tax=Corticibacter populi TaxID=1550736 RepID=A0A3M6QMN0_9BURK|nr:hypothetical protein D8I35_16115 [Corticibacter populi]RZS33357.1 hypothetical protein EV687_1679 [Corticibacter populi]
MASDKSIEEGFLLYELNLHVQDMNRLHAMLEEGHPPVAEWAELGCGLRDWLEGPALAQVTAAGATAQHLFEPLCAEHQGFHETRRAALHAFAGGDAARARHASSQMLRHASQLGRLLMALDDALRSAKSSKPDKSGMLVSEPLSEA